MGVGDPWKHGGQTQKQTLFHPVPLPRPSRSPHGDRVSELPVCSWQQKILIGAAALLFPPSLFFPGSSSLSKLFSTIKIIYCRDDQRFVQLRSEPAPVAKDCKAMSTVSALTEKVLETEERGKTALSLLAHECKICYVCIFVFCYLHFIRWFVFFAAP